MARRGAPAAELQRQALRDLPYLPLGQVLPRTACRAISVG